MCHTCGYMYVIHVNDMSVSVCTYIRNIKYLYVFVGVCMNYAQFDALYNSSRHLDNTRHMMSYIWIRLSLYI